MKKLLKWILGVVGVLVVAAAAAIFIGLQLADRKMARKIDVKVAPVAFTTDAQALERGKYLFESRGCVDCHGANGAGRTFVDDGKGLKIAGPDITSAGATRSYQPEDWVRSIRHGVKPNGNPLMVMPSEDYNRLTDEDFSALASYVKGLPPGGGAVAVVNLPLPARVLYGFGVIPDAAQRIDHSLAPAVPVPSGVTAQHGAYVANMCIGCHGDRLSGGKIPGGPPDWPPAANITPGDGTVMTRYPTAAEFTAMMRSGKRPDGSEIKVMPFGSLAKMSDVDLQATYEYLKTVPPRAAGGR